MRQVLVLAAVTALTVARPEVYKEKEDFQYSRSSSDDGTKSGYYGAQRGNMGGNYERAHNMDLLAQHQMGGLVRTVDGELGDGAKQKSGSVYSAANSRGVYGSGRYDLSNVEGRNFQEGTSYGGSHLHSSSQSLNAGFGSQDSLHSSLSSQTAGFGSQDSLHSSLSSQAAGFGSQDSKLHSSVSSQNTGFGSQAYSANRAYGTHSQNSLYSGYQTTGNTGDLVHANTHSSDNLQSASQYDAGRQAAQNSGYYLQSGYQGQSANDKTASTSHLSNAYGSSNTYGSNVRLVSASPVRVYIRPGGRVAIPLAAQSVDASHGSTSTFDQNAVNSEAEVLGSADQHTVYKPNNNAKHYETSYSYRKEWEKHDTKPIAGMAPVAVPTVNPYPSNSELYEDSQTQASELQQAASILEAQNQHLSNQYSGYNVKTGLSQSRHQSAYSAQQQQQQQHAASDTAAAVNMAGSSGYALGAHSHDASANINSLNLNSQVENLGSKPKSYQSSYSYHKSWERQGDPYVIKPATNGLYTTADAQSSQRLTASSLNQGANGYGQQYGAHYHQGQSGYSVNGGADCDENGHIRVARSYNLDQAPQESQKIYIGQESQNLEDLSQQSQNLENFGQQPQHLEDFGQQSQNLEDFGQQSRNLQDFGQQSQNLEDLGQQSQNLQDFGQQSQNLEEFGQESQKLEDFGQQSQNLQDFDQVQQSQLQVEVGQQAQNKWDQQEVGQQAQIQFDRAEDLGQHTQNQWDQQSQSVGQETQNAWNSEQNHGTNTAFEQQENVFEINHPSNLDNLHKSESHISPEDNSKQNAFAHFAHTTFDKPSQESEKIYSGNTDREVLKEQNGNEYNVGMIWTPALPSPNMNQNNPNVPVWPEDLYDKHPRPVPDWQQILNEQENIRRNHFNMDYGYSQHNNYQENTQFIPTYDNNNPNNYQHHGYFTNVNTYSPWVSPSSYSINAQHNYENGSSVNSYTNTQTQYSHYDHSTNSTSPTEIRPQESGSTSLTNLWNLLDGIENQTRDKTERIETNYSYHHENKENTQSNSNLDWTQNANDNTYDSKFKDINFNPDKVVMGTTEKQRIETTTMKQNKWHPHDVELGDNESIQTPRDEDVGRGDIGSDDAPSVTSTALNKPLVTIENKPIPIKPYRTPEEIETLSLTKETGQTALVNAQTVNLNSQTYVENYDKQHNHDFNILHHHTAQNDLQKTTSTTPRSGYNYLHSQINVQQSPEEIEQQNTDQQSEHFGQGEYLDQQSYDQFQNGFDQQSVNSDQQKVNNPMFDFGQQSENLGQEPMKQQIESFNLQTVNSDHHGFDVEHGPEEIQQHNMNQQFETTGQKSPNMNQEVLNEFDNLGQHNVNLGDLSVHLGQHQEKLDNFGQQSEGFNQENINDFGQHEQFQQESLSEFGHQNNDQQQQNEQQLENWGQENDNLKQQTQIEDLNQQVQVAWKPNEDLQQESQVETFEPPAPAVFNKEGREPQSFQQREPVVEPEIVKKQSSNVETPPEPVTEKVGFWKNVGSKFVGAKDKVASWFSKS